MSAELIILLVGTVLLVLTIADGIRLNPSYKGLINSKIRIPLGMLGVLMLIYGGYSYGAVNLQGQIETPVSGNKMEINFPIENIKVISPIAGDAVKCRILTMGVYPDDHSKDIWVLLKPSDGKYYPQSDHTNTSFKRNGEWQVVTRFGGDQEESYDIIVYETDAAASEFFSSTIQAWKDAESYPGIVEKDLPTGAKQVDKLVVSLAENCRGVF